MFLHSNFLRHNLPVSCRLQKGRGTMYVSSITVNSEPQIILSIKFYKYLLNYLSGNLNKTVDNEGFTEKYSEEIISKPKY